MKIYTIGFTQKSAEQFFELIKSNEIDLLVDVRLNNVSQLAGFAKNKDLQYFLKEICGTKYIHCDEYAPTKDLLERYRKGITTWDEYTVEYREIMNKRGGYKRFANRFSDNKRVCLLCSEATPEKCHRRLLAELIAETGQIEEIIHL